MSLNEGQLATTASSRQSGQRAPSTTTWAANYGQRHRLARVTEFPGSIKPPRKVRVYRRQSHYILQWWDPAAKKNLSVRVEGDLVDALARSREIDDRLEHFRSGGYGSGKLRYPQLIDLYIDDLQRRANAGEIAPTTVGRYASALAHFRRFTDLTAIHKQFPFASGANRAFRMAFATHLEQSQFKTGAVGPSRRMIGKSTVLDAVRAMFEWAADRTRGNLLPDGFANPFLRTRQDTCSQVRDSCGEPDITVAMAVDFLSECDDYQLPLFATILLYGLRAAEPMFLFREHIDGGWLNVNCLPEIGYLTKGRRNKRFPVLPVLSDLWRLQDVPGQGLLFTRRDVVTDAARAPLLGASYAVLCTEFRRRCQLHESPSAATRQSICKRLILEAGGLNYDRVEHEFQAVARGLNWSRESTLKDFRHLFSTCLENSGVGEFYRRFLMGHSLGRTPIVTYTHLNQLQVQFDKAVSLDLAPILSVISQRAQGSRLSK